MFFAFLQYAKCALQSLRIAYISGSAFPFETKNPKCVHTFDINCNGGNYACARIFASCLPFITFCLSDDSHEQTQFFGWCECARAVLLSTAWQLETVCLSMVHTQNVGITYESREPRLHTVNKSGWLQGQT